MLHGLKVSRVGSSRLSMGYLLPETVGAGRESAVST
jgi:hypothetical protein